jgi:intracellular sulfur oxidation DsrE/DsrF family protein
MKSLVPIRTALVMATLLAFGRLPADGTEKSIHRVVFDVAVSEPEAWKTVLRNISNLRKAFGAENTEVEVVAYSKGLGFLLASDKDLGPGIDALASQGVDFLACSNSLQAQGATAADLVPKAKVVDSGVAELVRKQEAGWSYIKVVAAP